MEPDRQETNFYFALAQVGLEMVAPIGLGVALDHYAGWRPWGTIGGAVIGFVGSLTHLISLVNAHDRTRNSGPKSSE
jgi:F0F1-type ATP synthase assembly protein I